MLDMKIFGKKLKGHRGVAAYLVAALFVLGKPSQYTVSEYITNTSDPA